MSEPLLQAVPATAGQDMRNAAIAGVGMSVPERVVGNDELAARLGVSERWISSRTGVRERRIAAAGDSVAGLAAEAGERALAAAGTAAGEVDVVIVATLAADHVTPNAAPMVARALGAPGAGALDVGAACTGFLSGLALACGLVESRRADNVLVIGAEILSRLTDPEDRRTAPLFADGAGAVLVGPSRDGGAIGPVVLRSEGDSAGLIGATHSERLIRMQGHETFREAVRRLSESTLEALERAGLDLGDIDLFVYHQANRRILAAVAERLALDPERVVDCIDRFGNTSAATIPIALAEARRQGRLRAGDSVLLGAFGAGLTWGAATLVWEGS